MIPVDAPEMGIDQFADGNRSVAVTGFLRNVGFDAYSVAGGTRGWARSGRPVVGGSAPRA